MAFIICFFQFLLIFKNEALDLAQVMRSYAPVACEKNRRLKPEFAVSVRRPDMYGEAHIPRRCKSENGTILCAELSAFTNHITLSVAWEYVLP
jgi:hypothetical protein